MMPDKHRKGCIKGGVEMKERWDGVQTEETGRDFQVEVEGEGRGRVVTCGLVKLDTTYYTGEEAKAQDGVFLLIKYADML